MTRPQAQQSNVVNHARWVTDGLLTVRLATDGPLTPAMAAAFGDVLAAADRFAATFPPEEPT